MDRFSLEIPSSPEYVGTARIFVGAVARSRGAEEEEVHDLKLAVSELCAAGAREGDGPVRIALAPDGSSLSVEVEAARSGTEPVPDEATPDSFARSVGLDVVRLLFPDAEEEEAAEGRVRVRFRFPRQE